MPTHDCVEPIKSSHFELLTVANSNDYGSSHTAAIDKWRDEAWSATNSTILGAAGGYAIAATTLLVDRQVFRERLSSSILAPEHVGDLFKMNGKLHSLDSINKLVPSFNEGRIIECAEKPLSNVQSLWAKFSPRIAAMDDACLVANSTHSMRLDGTAHFKGSVLGTASGRVLLAGMATGAAVGAADVAIGAIASRNFEKDSLCGRLLQSNLLTPVLTTAGLMMGPGIYGKVGFGLLCYGASKLYNLVGTSDHRYK